MKTSTSTTQTFGETVKLTHPFRGLLWGLMFGLGLAAVLVVTKLIALDLIMVIVIVLIGIILGVIWGTAGPSSAPKGPAPTTRTVVTHEASRFDDFDTDTLDAPDDAPAVTADPPGDDGDDG